MPAMDELCRRSSIGIRQFLVERRDRRCGRRHAPCMRHAVIV